MNSPLLVRCSLALLLLLLGLSPLLVRCPLPVLLSLGFSPLLVRCPLLVLLLLLGCSSLLVRCPLPVLLLLFWLCPCSFVALCRFAVVVGVRFLLAVSIYPARGKSIVLFYRPSPRPTPLESTTLPLLSHHHESPRHTAALCVAALRPWQPANPTILYFVLCYC